MIDRAAAGDAHALLVVQLGVGLASSACYQATIISNPTRLVIDIRNS